MSYRPALQLRRFGGLNRAGSWGASPRRAQLSQLERILEERLANVRSQIKELDRLSEQVPAPGYSTRGTWGARTPATRKPQQSQPSKPHRTK
jgi:hypothetical protein